MPPGCDTTQLLVHAKLYEVADKYGVPGLKDLSSDKFRSACDLFWPDEQFAIAAEYAFNTTPDGDEGLRKIVRDKLFVHRDLIKDPGVKQFLQKRPELMYELFLASITKSK